MLCVARVQVRVKCNEDDTIGDLKKLVAAQTGTRPEKIRIQKWYTIYKVCAVCQKAYRGTKPSRCWGDDDGVLWSGRHVWHSAKMLQGSMNVKGKISVLYPLGRT